MTAYRDVLKTLKKLQGETSDILSTLFIWRQIIQKHLSKYFVTCSQNVHVFMK